MIAGKGTSDMDTAKDGIELGGVVAQIAGKVVEVKLVVGIDDAHGMLERKLGGECQHGVVFSSSTNEKPDVAVGNVG